MSKPPPKKRRSVPWGDHVLRGRRARVTANPVDAAYLNIVDTAYRMLGILPKKKPAKS